MEAWVKCPVHKDLLNPKCVCCGSDQHGLLTIVDDEPGRLTFKCPVVGVEDWSWAIKVMIQRTNYGASEAKFAEYYGKDPRVLRKALDDYSKSGAGRSLSYMQMVDFDSDVSRLANRKRKEEAGITQPGL
jgi:hypothetical protein